MSPIVAYQLWKTKTIPKILFGMEVLIVTQTDKLKCERLQCKVCKQIQGLPQQTSNLGTYSLLGTEFVESLLDENISVY